MSKLPRHLFRHHKNEDLVSSILALSVKVVKEAKERKILIEALRKKGDFFTILRSLKLVLGT